MFPAVLTYRVIAFWLPIPPGIVAFVQLRKYRRASGSASDAERRKRAILQKVK